MKEQIGGSDDGDLSKVNAGGSDLASDKYICPSCKSVFLSLSQLVMHINRCKFLEKVGYLQQADQHDDNE